ncbi:hypothetical protein SAMN04487917_101359 [Arthrobacter sp. yr096]|uniref:hypothetical protein n=1 Tax=Arthrobacter sp. yr096 TaxID=1761750 RepID=UPI0008CC4ED8|nr:hypothetical protein [Arthrobacter sp. yr096]SEI45057.1 hypothetical protein SAMN04487917_101359 [Arthrobacter sp. yr096]
MSHECTTEGCLNHGDGYLCEQCLSDLQAWIDQIPRLIETLGVTIGKLDQVRPANAGWNSGGKPGSAAPINLDALQLQENLKTVASKAEHYKHDPMAAGIAWMIQDWVTSAELAVSGPEEPTIDQFALNARVKEARGEPMPPRQAIDYVRKKTKITVKMDDFKNWVKLGHLPYVFDRVTIDDKPSRIYFPGDVFRVAQRMRERRIKV